MLTDQQIKQARYQAPDKEQNKSGLTKLVDGDGLFVRLKPNGSKLWQFRYTFETIDPTGQRKLVENTLSFGSYPEVPLASKIVDGIKIRGARELATKARELRAQGINPASVRDMFKPSATSTDSFETIAREWLAKREERLVPTYYRTIIERLEKNIFPFLGSRSISLLTASEFLKPLQRVENRGALESAHRILGICSQICRYAVAKGMIESDPLRDLKGALETPNKKHYPTLTSERDISGLLRNIDQYYGQPQTRLALQFGILTFVRPGNLRMAEWSEIHHLEDPTKAVWKIPGKKMKIRTQKDFQVPLSNQAISLINELKPLTGRSRFLFPSPRSNNRPMSNNTLNAALRRLGYSKDEMTAHGVRAMARTVCHETLGFAPEVIEEQLAHGKPGPLGGAYDRTQHLPARRELMQKWADWLDSIQG